ncbi:MAG: transcriptional regulator [Gammaproteobacteria bacterium]|nr:MAG: transcriptional regulator [Gammaproteobacteria bacterium]
MMDKNNNEVSLYRQIVDELISSIQNGLLSSGDPISSLNELKSRYQVSRDTVIKAYNELKIRGIIDSKPGKGYYVRSTNIEVQKKVFLLLDENSSYKSILYESFLGNCSRETQVDVFFHHQNPTLFKTLLKTYTGKFSHYVITPVPETDCMDQVKELANKGKVFILDYGFNEEQHLYPSVFQDFEEDMFSQLMENRASFEKYQKTLMVIKRPSGSTENAFISKMIRGFQKFARKTGLQVELSRTLPAEIQKGYCYILHSDADLVEMVKTAQCTKLEPGKDIGIISYNETPIKSVVAKGISTLSTNFPEMGKYMAALVEGGQKEHIKNEFRLIRRASF